MAKARIVPLDCGQITQVEKSGQLYLTEPGTKICAQIIVWAIITDDMVAVVDVGPGSPDLVRDRHGRELVQSAEQRPQAALGALGIQPTDVDVVIQTHLHWDHCLSLEERPYPNADIYVQRAELQYAAAPYPAHAGIYDAGVLRTLLPAFGRTAEGIKIIDGDFRLAPGVDLLLSPGHSPGVQAVMVETDAGIHAIASDNVPFAEGWSGRTLEDWVPPGVHVNLDDCYRSMSRIASLADHVLPAHDPIVFEDLARFAL